MLRSHKQEYLYVQFSGTSVIYANSDCLCSLIEKAEISATCDSTSLREWLFKLTILSISYTLCGVVLDGGKFESVDEHCC